MKLIKVSLTEDGEVKVEKVEIPNNCKFLKRNLKK